MSRVHLARPWLDFDLGAPMQVLSWAINRPGFVTARRIVWREVRNADLTLGMDVKPWLEAELQARDAADAVCLLTSRDVTRFHEESTQRGADRVTCVATTGLSNAERIGARVDRSAKDWGTINIAVAVETGLTQTAMIEALSIAAQARTAAILDTGLALPGGGMATGTGTDCIAVAAPAGACDYAGLHTALGEAIGAAVYSAVQGGASDWMIETAATRKDAT